SLGIPRYDGGLFDPSSPENQFLEDHKLSDRAVAWAVDTLVRDAGEPVDYAYIGVQNLGSIYEGLLENRLHVVDAAAGKVELIGDQGERKATGSYYTPDYIVAYIVQHTLDPILEERDEAFQTAMDRCAELRRRLTEVSDATTAQRLRGELDEAERDAREGFLGIKVLDPAMGSGHFLVNAVDHLTDAIIRRMQVYHDQHPDVSWDWNPIQRLIEQVRRAILGEMERQGIQLDPARLDDTALLTRLVMKRCIYGVDLNRMAVELAKVSLWLHTFTVGAPLSFLDHHLRWGNSLIGTDVRTVEEQIRKTGAGQLSLWQGPFAGLLDLTGLMVEVVERADATLADVQRSAETFKQFQRELTPYKQVLDLWVSQCFGNERAKEFLTVQGDAVVPALKGKRDVPEKYEDAITEARELYEEKRFFHWDLEFPEVFVDLPKRDWGENPGFDAVVGNPPYVSVTNIAPELRRYLLERFDTATGRFDVYIVFDEQALTLLREAGMFSFIQPIKFAIFANGKPVRDLLLKRSRIEYIVDVSQSCVFPDPSTYPCVLVVRKDVPSPNHQSGIVTPSRAHPESISSVGGEHVTLLEIPQSRFRETPEHVFCLRLSDGVWNLMTRVDLISYSLGEEFTIEQCVRIGSRAKRVRLVLDNQEYLVAPPEIKEACKKMLDGKNVGRYTIDWDGSWLHYLPGELYNPKSVDLLENPKVLIKRIAPSLTAVPDVGRNGEYFYPLNTIYALVPKDTVVHSLGYITALLNSSFLDWYYKLLFEAIAIRGGYIEYREYLDYMPIRRIAFVTSADERERLTEAAMDKAIEWIEASEGGSPDSVSLSAFSGSNFGRWLDERLSPVYSPAPELIREHNAD
ncbi:MAG: Eco57I restriction-modification methylase domain-containing protein, partial [Chloroflexota bacterium]